MSLPALPRGWARATVGDLADYINGLAFKPSDWEAHGRPIIRIQNLTGSSRSFNRTTREVEHRYVVATGDILVSWSATLDAYIWVGPEAVLNQHIFRVLPREGLVDRGLLYWGLKQVIGEMWRGEHTHGSTMKHINRGPFLAHTFNLPPLNEQRRIAAKIEALTARSRAAREALAQVPPLLERFRQSVLAAAFRGDLTAEWRRQHPDVEPASVLLERIRAERRRRWEEAELAAMRAKGKEPANDKWKERYEDPPPLDNSDLPGLPRGWAWAPLELLADPRRPIGYGVVQPGEEGTAVGVPLVRVCDIGDDLDVDCTTLRTISPEIHAAYTRTQLRGGEVLVTVVGTIGRIAVVSDERLFGANVARAVAVVAPLLPGFGEWLGRWLTGPRMQDWLTREGREVARKTLNISSLTRCPVAVPPDGERRAALLRLDAALGQRHTIRAAAQGAHESLALLDQSILAKAFRGELVSQNPNDEPASVLLERIRAEREAAGAGGARARRGRRGRASEAEPTRAEDEPDHAPSAARANGTNGNGSTLHAVLGALKREALHRIADAEGVELADRRSLDAARAGVIDGGVTLEAALEHLDRDELKAVCRSLGLADRGRTKSELRARIAGRGSR